MNEIVTIPQAAHAQAISHAPALGFREIQQLATSIAASGLFGIKTPDQALALMMIAQAEGRHPALAARDYDVISGRPAKKAEAMQRDFLTAGGRIEWHALADDLADATFSHPQGGSVRITWDMARAKKAALLGKDMYAKFPRQMLRARTISEGVRTVWPLATSGLYVAEEVAEMPPKPEPKREPPHRGPTLDAEAEAEPAPSVESAPVTRNDKQWQAWLHRLRQATETAAKRAAVVEIGGRQSVLDAIATAPTWVRDEINGLLADAFAKHPEVDVVEELEAEAADDGWPGPKP